MRAATLITTLRAKIVATTAATMLVMVGSVALMPAAVSAEGGAPVVSNQISGTVTGAGRGLSLPVRVYREQADHSWTLVSTSVSQDDNAGRFTTDPLGAGSFRIQVDGGHEFKSEFYDDVQTGDINNPAVETVTLDGSSGSVGVNFDLEAYEVYAVSGTASWIEGSSGTFTVYATRQGETESVNAAVSNPLGEYSINLRPGAYTLTFWDNMGRVLDESLDVDVVDADLPGKDIEFASPYEATPRWGKITGTLVSNGFPANGSNVLLFQYLSVAPGVSGWMQLEGVVADDDGRFVMPDVRAGETYTLLAKAPGGGNQYVYYGGQTSTSDEPGALAATNLNSFTVREGRTFDAGEIDFSASGVPFRSAHTPTIQGRAAVGSTLTVTTNTTLWDPAYPRLTYRWLRNGTPIPNATGPSYIPTAADLGANIHVVAIATAPPSDVTYLPARVHSAQTASVEAGTLTAPTPTINGTAAVSKTLSVSTGAWTPGTSLAYQWYRGSSAIPGATSSTYSLAAADLGKRFSARVAGSQAGYNTVSNLSSATRPAVAAKFSAAPTPKIKGKAKVGKTLKVLPGAWKPSGTRLTYQWFAGGKKIAKATKAKYKVSPKVRGKKITVRVTGSKPGYQSLTKKSKATKVG